MNVVAFSGSARRGGNTAMLIKEAFTALEKEGIATELVELAGESIHGCAACYKCFGNQNQRCAGVDDFVNTCIEKMLGAEGIILASPTYFADLTAEIKALIDRAGMTARANGNMLRRKVGAAIAVARRGGAIHTFDSLNHFFSISEMIIPGANYWNLGFGHKPGEVAQDQEALSTMRVLGENMAWVLQRLYG